MPETILEGKVLDEYKNQMTRYSVYVSRKRAMPEYRDGLKPIHRKVLYSMLAETRCIDRYTKCATIVGDALRYSPHGDTSVYGAMKTLANWFEIKVPLIDGSGNFGNFQGDDAAAYRYTEARISKFTMECILNELVETKEVVDWVPNYDGTTMEPEFLPAKIPLLLINGTFGIGVGNKVEIPAHNLNEVIDATLALIDNPDIPIVLVPDQCQPCYIFNTDFQTISNTGFGSYKVRGIIDIEEFEGYQSLVIKSTPDLTYLDSITEKIEELIQTNKIVQIRDCFDKSKVHAMRYIIQLKRGADPNYVREVIYKNTDMEQNCRINFEVLDGITPMRMSYKAYLLAFIEFRKLTKFRLYCNKLQDVQTKIHEKDAYIKVLRSGDINNIIHMIQNQTKLDDNYLVEYLISKLGITDLQASFIINCNIKKLSMAYLNKYEQEAIELEQLKQKYLSIIVSDELILADIKQELLYFKQKYGTKRICPIINPKDISDIPKGEFKIIITENNYIKKVQINESIGSFRGDNPKRVIRVENTENILLFDELGKVFKLQVHKIPFTDRSSNGTDIRILVKNLTSNINTVMYEPIVKNLADKVDKFFMVVITANGSIKKMDLGDFTTIPLSGMSYIKLEPGDIVQDVMIINNRLDIIVYSDTKAIRMNMNNIPHYKRNAMGSRAMSTDNKIDGLSVIKPDTTDIVVITASGKINRFAVAGMPISERAKAGNKVIKLSKGDKIKDIYGLNINDTIRVITKNDRLEIPISSLEVGSSISAGNKVIPLNKGDMIIRCDILKNRG